MDKKKVRVTLEVLDTSQPSTAQYIEENIKEVCERENLTVEEKLYFVVFV